MNKAAQALGRLAKGVPKSFSAAELERRRKLMVGINARKRKASKAKKRNAGVQHLEMKTLFYAGQPGDGYGWGVCNRNLIREFGKRCNLITSPPKGIPLGEWPHTVFMPLADHDLNPVSQARGARNLAYTFFEYSLGPKAAENAKRYDLIFCGSTWCKERLAEIGVTNTKVLIQGVDHEIFFPYQHARSAHNPTKFCIFSGGKFEYRKGQDIVIAAFREFIKTHPEAKLVCCWHNPWPELINGMKESELLKFPFCAFLHSAQNAFYRLLLLENGIPKNNFEIHGQLTQQQLADVMRSTDLGVFPNRCEGGTNLVLMEYIACGKTTIASHGTGHLDLGGSYFRLTGTETPLRWCEIDPIQLSNAMDMLSRKLLRNMPPEEVSEWTWERAAKTILEEV